MPTVSNNGQHTRKSNRSAPGRSRRITQMMAALALQLARCQQHPERPGAGKACRRKLNDPRAPAPFRVWGRRPTTDTRRRAGSPGKVAKPNHCSTAGTQGRFVKAMWRQAGSDSEREGSQEVHGYNSVRETSPASGSLETGITRQSAAMASTHSERNPIQTKLPAQRTRPPEAAKKFKATIAGTRR